jgi:hypothetical protein
VWNGGWLQPIIYDRHPPFPSAWPLFATCAHIVPRTAGRIRKSLRLRGSFLVPRLLYRQLQWWHHKRQAKGIHGKLERDSRLSEVRWQRYHARTRRDKHAGDRWLLGVWVRAGTSGSDSRIHAAAASSGGTQASGNTNVRRLKPHNETLTPVPVVNNTSPLSLLRTTQRSAPALVSSRA